jgi:hypothetical protein
LLPTSTSSLTTVLKSARPPAPADEEEEGSVGGGEGERKRRLDWMTEKRPKRPGPLWETVMVELRRMREMVWVEVRVGWRRERS